MDMLNKSVLLIWLLILFLSFYLSKNDTEVKTNDELIKKDIIFN